MSTDKKRPEGKGAGHLPEVFRRIFLRGDFRREGHVEVLLPADDRVVRAAEGDIGAAIREEHRQSGKLRLRFLVNPIHIAEQAHIGEARGLCRMLYQNGNLIGHENTHVGFRVGGKIGAGRVKERHLLRLKACGYKAGEIQIADFRQNQIVHLVERPLRKRQIAAPVEILKNVCHGSLPEDVFCLSYTFFPIGSRKKRLNFS